jgi:hypothetical protein
MSPLPRLFARSVTLPCCVLTMLLLSGCGPSVLITQSPVQPTNAQNVTYTSQVSGTGITSVEIWESRYTLGVCSNGMQCAFFQSSALLHTCSYTVPASSPTCTFTTTAPYPDGSFIGFKSIAHAMDGSTGTDGWVYYAAGAFPWQNNPIPIRGSAAPAEAIDVVFIPDTDFKGNNGNFITATTNLLTQGYLSNQAFAQEVRTWRGFWNFYVTYQTGHAAGYPNNPCNTTPANWANLRTIIDVGAIVHTANVRDCGGRGPENGAVFSIMVGNFNTLVHESGHAVFGLADEYCCDGGYWQDSPQPNVFSSLNSCQTNATTNGWPTTDCTQISSGAQTIQQWRSDNGNDLMAGGGAFGRSDKSEVFWLYFQRCSTSTGC